MHFYRAFLLGSFIFVNISNGLPQPTYPPDAVDKLAAQGLLKLAVYEAKHKTNSTCTLANAVKRREWLVKHKILSTKHDLIVLGRILPLLSA
jgi:hypothetical protein